MRRFHAAGIEMILDVVCNHTCEGSELGPRLFFRGLDNASTTACCSATRFCARVAASRATATGAGHCLGRADSSAIRGKTFPWLMDSKLTAYLPKDSAPRYRFRGPDNASH
jgi:hypothetical protein